MKKSKKKSKTLACLYVDSVLVRQELDMLKVSLQTILRETELDYTVMILEGCKQNDFKVFRVSDKIYHRMPEIIAAITNRGDGA